MQSRSVGGRVHVSQAIEVGREHKGTAMGDVDLFDDLLRLDHPGWRRVHTGGCDRAAQQHGLTAGDSISSPLRRLWPAVGRSPGHRL